MNDLEKLKKDINLNNEQVGVTVSGGKDSIFVWSKLVELLGKDKVVAFFYNRPKIVHPLALENIKSAEQILGSTVVTYTDNRAFERLEKNAKILLNNYNPAAVRVLLCAGCRYGITEQLYKIGSGLGITKFVSGASKLELAPFKEKLIEDLSANHDIDEGFEILLKQYPELEYEDNLSVIERDHNYKFMNNTTGKNNFARRYPFKVFDFFDYYNNNPDEIEEYVTKNLNWKHPEGRTWHFDCIVEELKDILYYNSLGYTEYNCKLNAMIDNNLISQEEAERKLNQHNNKIMREDIFSKMKELGIDI